MKRKRFVLTKEMMTNEDNKIRRSGWRKSEKKKDSPESYRGQKAEWHCLERGRQVQQLKRVGKNLMAASNRERNEEDGKNYVLVSISF